VSTEELRKLLLSGFVGVTVSGLLVLSSYARLVAPVQDVFDYIAEPVQTVGLSIDRGITQFFNSFGSFASIRTENQSLRDEVVALREKTSELEALRDENEYLRNLTGVSSGINTEMVLAEVLSYERDIAGTSGIKLSKGEIDGVYEGAIVYAQYGALLGRVVSVGQYTCIIETIATPQQRMPVMIEGSSALGLLIGENDEILVVENVDRNAITPIGASVVTTGESSDYPPLLAVGTVKSEVIDPASAFKKLEVEPLFDEETLSFVLIELQ